MVKTKPKLAGTRPMSRKVPASLTLPQWRAVAAVLDVAISISDDAVRTSILNTIYTDLAKQLNLDLHPILEENNESDTVEE